MPFSGHTSIQRKFFIFLNCVLLSGFLWVLVTLSNEHTTLIKVPIKYARIPSSILITNSLPSEVTLEVKAFGFQLLAQQISKSWGTLEVIVNTPMLSDRQVGEFQINLKSQRQQLAQQLGSNFSVQAISPDTITFKYSLKKARYIPVAYQYHLEFSPAYGLCKPVSTQIDSIFCVGPEMQLLKLDSIRTEVVDFKNIDKPIDTEFALVFPPYISSQTQKVSMHASVCKFTEKKITVPVRTLNCPAQYQCFSTPTAVILTCLVPLSDFSQLSASSFDVGADVGQKHVLNAQIIPKVLQKPWNVKVLNVEPQYISWIAKIDQE